MHPDLRTAGALPSLDMPHHLRSDESCPYREGLTVRTGIGSGGAIGTTVDCGLQQQAFVPVDLESNTRVTVRLPQQITAGEKPLDCEAVAPDTPREEAGYYWGYSVRQASSLSAAFTESPYDGGYDTSIGMSERGKPLDSLLNNSSGARVEPTWNHLLIVFGGIAGLEAALRVDKELLSSGVTEASEVFDHWINLVPSQGSRTIRTEEAVWIGLSSLQPIVEMRNGISDRSGSMSRSS